MLEAPEGATIPEIVAATGWQSHTVRGAFAGRTLFITDFGTYETGDSLARMVGSLVRVEVDTAGAEPLRGEIGGSP